MSGWGKGTGKKLPGPGSGSAVKRPSSTVVAARKSQKQARTKDDDDEEEARPSTSAPATPTTSYAIMNVVSVMTRAVGGSPKDNDVGPKENESSPHQTDDCEAVAIIDLTSNDVLTHGTLQEALRCHICLEVAASPIVSCKEKYHILCYSCKEKLPYPKVCPVSSCGCREYEMCGPVQVFAEKLNWMRKCTNAKDGCKDKVLSTAMQYHLPLCHFRDILCNYEKCKKEPINFKQYKKHLHHFHDFPLPPWSPEKHLTFMFEIPAAPAPEMVFDFPGATQTFGDCFILRMQLTESIFYIWMAVMGDKRDARKYYTTIGLFGKPKLPNNTPTISWSVPVIPYHQPEANKIEKDHPAFGSMARKLFMNTTSFVASLHGKATIRFSIQVDILKKSEEEAMKIKEEEEES